MAPTKSTSNQSKRALAAKKKFDKEWEEATKMFATPQDGSTGENAPELSYRRETSPGGTIHEYYADGTEKKPDEFTAAPVTLGRRIVLGHAHPAPVGGLVNMHGLYGAETDRLKETFQINDSNPEVETFQRAALRTLPEEWVFSTDISKLPLTERFRELKATAQLAGLMPLDQLALNTRILQTLEEFYKEYGMPNAAEVELLARYGRVRPRVIQDWCKHIGLLDEKKINKADLDQVAKKKESMEPHFRMLEAAGVPPLWAIPLSDWVQSVKGSQPHSSSIPRITSWRKYRNGFALIPCDQRLQQL